MRRWALGLALAGAFAQLPVGRADYSDAELAAVQTPKEAQIREIRNAEITQLRIALGRRLEKNRQAELYFRLAEVYLEAYRMEFLLEGRVFEQKLRQMPGASSKRLRLDRGRSRALIRKGLQACEDIDRLGVRPSPRMDAVLYFRAFFLSELEERAKALAVYQRLIRDFPQSPLLSEAYEAVALDLFERNRFKEALPVFERAIARSQSSSMSRAKTAVLYHKMAWSYYRLRQFDRALETMKTAIEIARSQQGDTQPEFLSIREEALRDMAVFFTERGKVDEALAYFQDVAGDARYFGQALEKLGKEYERTLKTSEAIRAYEALLRARPEDDTARRVFVHLVELDLKRRDFEGALKRAQNAEMLDRLYAHRSPQDPSWDNLKAWIRRTATTAHQAFQKQGTRGQLSVAERYYAFYLEKLLSRDDARNETHEIKLYLAEVKREVGKPVESAQLYKELLASGEGRYAKQAGLLWMQSLELSLKKLKDERPQASRTAPSEIEREFVEAVDLYLKAKPDGWAAALKAAQVLAGYTETQSDAVRRIQWLLDEAPRTPEAWTAAQLWLQLEGTPRVTDTLRRYTALLESDARAHDRKLLKRMQAIERTVRVQAIDQAEKSQQWTQALDEYRALLKTDLTQDQLETAYAKMIDLADLAHDPQQMVGHAMEWFRRFPQSPRALEGMRSVATRLLIYGSYRASADAFEQLGMTSRDDKSLETAARIYEGDLDFVKARMTRQKFLRLYGKSPLLPSVLLALAESSDGVQAVAFLKQCAELKSSLRGECKAKLGDAYAALQDVAQAETWYARAASHDDSPYYRSYASYRQAELSSRRLSFRPLDVSSPATLGKTLKQRLEQIQTLRNRYNSVIQQGGPWGISALARLTDQTEAVATELEKAGKWAQSLLPALRQQIDAARQQAYQQAIKGKILSPAVPRLHHQLVIHRVVRAYDAQGVFARMRIVGVGPSQSDALEPTRRALLKNPRDSARWVDYGNLLWGERKPLLAQIAYERAIALDERNAAAHNNRGVVEFLQSPVSTLSPQKALQQEWIRAHDAMGSFQRALSLQEGFLAAHYNRAALYTYFRLFSLAQNSWERALAQAPLGDAYLGLAMAQLGQGALAASLRSREDAENKKAEPTPSENVYWLVAQGTQADACRESVGALDAAQLWGFEKQGILDLKETCERWTESKSSQQK